MKAGNKVVCINDNNLYNTHVRNICKGIIYTLTEVFTCNCGNIYVCLAEVNEEVFICCPKCDVFENTIMYYHIERFRPLNASEKYLTRQKVIQEPSLN